MNVDFQGQRADKIRVRPAEGEEVPDTDGLGIPKKVEHYTVTCPECDGVGYYEERGEIICEDCDIVITGDQSVSLPYDFGGSRGFRSGPESTRHRFGHEGTTEPLI